MLNFNATVTDALPAGEARVQAAVLAGVSEFRRTLSVYR